MTELKPAKSRMADLVRFYEILADRRRSRPVTLNGPKIRIEIDWLKEK
jgi:hypothetical protein